MAWTKVGELQFTVADGAGTETKTLPGTPVEGDIVIIVMANDQAIDNGISTAGYISLEWDNAITDPGHLIAYKQLGSIPDTEVVINQPSGEYSAGVLQVWRGASVATPIDAERTVTTGESGMPNSPSYTPVTNNALVLTIGCLDDNNIAGSVTVPSGYSDLLAHDNTANGDNASVMIASKKLASAGAEDPDIFGGAGNNDWRAITVAFRPLIGKVNIGDAWKDIIEGQINIGDVWKDVAEIHINIGDVWKRIF